MEKSDKILILGATGLVGSTIKKILAQQGYENVLTPTRSELDLLKQEDVFKYFSNNRPSHVFNAAAKVGGILDNDTYRADYILENISIQHNVILASLKSDVEKFLFIGSSCIYPKEAPQPLKEEYLLTGPLEQTNEPFAIAKLSGIKTCESIRRQYKKNFLSILSTSLYGENDNYDLKSSHVIPGLIARMKIAKDNGDKEFKVWGTGNPKREFLFVDDMSSACIHIMKYQGDLPYTMNVGSGEDISIKDLAMIIKDKVGFEGEITFDSTKPDGTMKKQLDISKIKSLGWEPKIDLDTGIKRVVDHYINNLHKA